MLLSEAHTPNSFCGPAGLDHTWNKTSVSGLHAHRNSKAVFRHRSHFEVERMWFHRSPELGCGYTQTWDRSREITYKARLAAEQKKQPGAVERFAGGRREMVPGRESILAPAPSSGPDNRTTSAGGQRGSEAKAQLQAAPQNKKMGEVKPVLTFGCTLSSLSRAYCSTAEPSTLLTTTPLQGNGTQRPASPLGPPALS